MRLKDKVTTVTGASRGVGAETASMFAAEGARVVLTVRSMEEVEQLWQSISRQGGESICVSTDVHNRESIENTVKTACDAYGAIDILVSNVGYPIFGYTVDDEDGEAGKRYETIMETNVRGYWYGARFVVPYMKERNRGNIINIPSVRGRLGLANETTYCAAKGAVKMITKALAVELVPCNIRVNYISPRAIQVKVGHWVLSRYDQEVYDEYVEKSRDVHLLDMEYNQPLHMIGEPRDIGYIAAYLAPEEARFVTGSDIVVDGGLASLLPGPDALDMKTLVALHGKQGSMGQWFQPLGWQDVLYKKSSRKSERQETLRVHQGPKEDRNVD